MPPSPRRKKAPPHRGPGRPDTGIRSGYVRVEAYVPTDLRESLDRIADRQTQRSGRSVSRTDIVRQALVDYLEKHLSQKD